MIVPGMTTGVAVRIWLDVMWELLRGWLWQ